MLEFFGRAMVLDAIRVVFEVDGMNKGEREDAAETLPVVKNVDMESMESMARGPDRPAERMDSIVKYLNCAPLVWVSLNSSQSGDHIQGGNGRRL
jgi:hypothetical protein